MTLTSHDIKKHYLDPQVKTTIIRCGSDDGFQRAGNYDFTGWYQYDDNQRQLFNLHEDYDKLIMKVRRSLYWTLNFFEDNTFTIKTNDPDQRLGTGKETIAYTLGIDIDIKEGYNILNKYAALSLEECIAYFYNSLSKYINPQNIYAAFSGGGAYVYLHHHLFQLPNGDGEGVDREDSWAVLRAMYQLLMEDISEEFFREHPDAEKYVKVDYLNNDKRLFKTIYSVHKSEDYAVIPLQPPYFTIDPDNATLPLPKKVLDLGETWYTYHDDQEGRNRLLFKLKEYEWVAKSLHNISKITVEDTKPVSSVKIELDSKTICPVMEAILSDEDWGDGTHRRIVTGTIYLSHLGWNYQEIYDYITMKASNWEPVKGINTLVKYWMKVQMPSYNTLYGKGKFPIPGFHEFAGKLPEQPDSAKDSVRYTIRKIEEKGLQSGLPGVTVHFRFRGERRYDYSIVDEKSGQVVYSKLKYDKSPIEIGSKTEVFREIARHIHTQNNNNGGGGKEETELQVKTLLRDLDRQRNEYYHIKDFKQKYTNNLRSYKDVANLDEAEKALRDEENILIYIGSVADWMVAGERLNILFGFLCALNLLMFGQPLNFIATGMPGSGKTAIENTIFDMLPSEDVSWEKKPTVASIFRRSEDDPNFYDKKIVYMGDLGGDKDMETTEEARSIFKELNSDGRISRPVSTKSDDAWVTQDLLLTGKPALFYTTVHDYKLNDQEVSRGFVISPRLDNTEMVNVMYERIRAVKGRTLRTREQIKNYELSKIRNIVRFLKELEGITVVNPYPHVLKKMISESPFIKRDYQKIMMLAETITLLNYNDRKTWESEDEKYILTSKQDIMFLYQLLENYMESIHLNVPKSLLELHSLLEDEFSWDTEFSVTEVRKGVDVRAHPNLAEELRKLASIGLLSISDTPGKHNKNYYTLVSLKPTIINPETDLVLDESKKKMLSYEHSAEFLSFVVEHENAIPILDIHHWGLDSYNPPPWEVFEPRRNVKRVKLESHRIGDGVGV